MNVSERGELTDLLETYLSNEADLSQKITEKGRIPEEITDRSHCSQLKYITELPESKFQLVETFVNWMKEVGADENGFRFEQSTDPDEDPWVAVDTGKKRDGVPLSRREVIQDRDVIQFFNVLYRRSTILTCDHLSLSDDKEKLLKNARLLVKKKRGGSTHRKQIGSDPESESGPQYRKEEFTIFSCEDCVEDENRTKCDCLSFDGIVYEDSSCGWRRGLFQKNAEEQGLQIRDLGTERRFGTHFTFFLPELDALFTKRRLEGSEVLDKLDPSVVVVYGEKDDLIEILEYDTDFLVISKEDQSFYYFDSDRALDNSDSDLIGRIIEDLDEYTEQERGKEHTRIQNALLNIGEEDGYIVQEEYTVSGLTVDAIWFKRDNQETKLVAEVETTGGWKKDILSMWETEPDIALLITTNHKTDKVAKDLARFSVIEYTPYKLVYANLNTRNVYVFEDGQILGRFELGENVKEELEEEPGFDIENL